MTDKFSAIIKLTNLRVVPNKITSLITKNKKINLSFESIDNFYIYSSNKGIYLYLVNDYSRFDISNFLSIYQNTFLKNFSIKFISDNFKDSVTYYDKYNESIFEIYEDNVAWSAALISSKEIEKYGKEVFLNSPYDVKRELLDGSILLSFNEFLYANEKQTLEVANYMQLNNIKND